MDYLKNKFVDLEKGIAALDEVLRGEKTELNRDAALKRFEFTFELLWKSIKLYLKEFEKVDCFSPGSCFREMRANLDIDASAIEQCLNMGEDRNLSVRTYSEEMADALYDKLPDYLIAMKIVAQKIKGKASL